jgi:hypothetical protein
MEPLCTAVAGTDGRGGPATSADGQLDLNLVFPPALTGDGTSARDCVT